MPANPIDTWLFEAFNGLGRPWLDPLFIVLSERAFGFAAAGVFCAWLAARKRWTALWALLAGVLAVALADLLGARVFKPWIGRTRPAFALPPDEVRVVVPIARSGSMPSNHAGNAFAMAVVVVMADRGTAPVVLGVAAAIALSRVYLGVHWPTDVLAGAVLGTVCAVFSWWSIAGMRAAWKRWRR